MSNQSMVHGHAQYVKGVAEEAIGNITGSESWKSSGAKDKESSIQEMRNANESGPLNDSVSGRTEKDIGKALGCEGMVRNGEIKEANEISKDLPSSYQNQAYISEELNLM